MTYSEKVKFILDYVIFLGVQSNESGLLRYHYELSKDEVVDVIPIQDLMKFSMYGEELASMHIDASEFDETQRSAIDIFYENILSKLPQPTDIPDNMADKVRKATEDSHKEWVGITIVREKDMGKGLTYKVTQVQSTGTCMFEVKGYITKSLYIIRFGTGQFFDVSEPIYERLFNKQ